jgi:hypothetical protein
MGFRKARRGSKDDGPEGQCDYVIPDPTPGGTDSSFVFFFEPVFIPEYKPEAKRGRS